ncbi:hypothetical protein WN59_06640 [Salinicoccus sediminis]|uniref:Uncharacterized protein n=1 Tax=Salinicoccus sediminis TaxID=1432562 RepID=A0A0M2SKC5_9STAP|nr:hypothetical protein [Salinicoccus sediminis]KKK34703.1 hypothetical protein WN59_06640 [Salinicoccus sediminis]
MEHTSEGIPEELKNLKIIVGQEPYKEDDKVKCETKHLKGIDCEKFYQYFDTVAFVTGKLSPFKHTLENVLNLLYYNKNCKIRDEYIHIATNNNWLSFVNNMYKDYKMVFINQNELDLKCNTTNQIINYAESILMCGNQAEKTIKSITKATTSNAKLFLSVHPSTITSSNTRYIDDWISIQTNGILSIHQNNYDHSVKLDFML